MAAFTICSGFGAQKNKVWHCFHCFPIFLILTSTGSSKKFQKNIYFFFIDYVKAFDCVDHNKLRKILKEIEYQSTWPASWETYMQVRKQQLELDMEQQTGPK